MWLQGRQARRLALGADQDERSTARRTAVAGPGARDLVGRECGLPGRGRAADATAGRSAGHSYRAAARQRPARAAGGKLLSARAVAAGRSVAEWSGCAAWTTTARALAQKS